MQLCRRGGVPETPVPHTGPFCPALVDITQKGPTGAEASSQGRGGLTPTEDLGTSVDDLCALR